MLGIMNKNELRRLFLHTRAQMPVEEARAYAGAIHARLLAMPEVAATPLVLTYVSAKNNEVDTKELIRALLNMGKAVAVPRTMGTGQMEWLRIDSLEELLPARFGLLEPPDNPSKHIASVVTTVVLVPGLAFTPQGFRIGFGGGYFDRFLCDFPGTSIGLAYDRQITGSFAPESHDVPVRYIVTESQLLSCRPKSVHELDAE